MSNWDIKKIREDFPALNQKVHGKDLVYFDNAATSLKCRPVIERLTNYYTMETANVHRGIHLLSEQGTINFDGSRRRVQEFIGAKHEHEILFTKGTTEGLNLIAQSYGSAFLKEGDEILLTTMEHHSNIVPWQLVAEKVGAKIVEAPITDEGEIDLDEFQKKLNSKTKIVSFTHVSNTLGTINPAKKITQMAHDSGAIVVLDAAQSIPHMKVDVQDLNVDFLVFSSHKIFGPGAVGIVYGRENWLEQMPPYQGGGAMIDEVTFQKTTYNELPHKFEAGTPAIAEVIALKPALDYVESLGLDRIYEAEAQLLSYATGKLKELEGVRILGEAKEKASVLSFTIDGTHPHDLGTLLDQQGIAIRTGHHCTQPLLKRMGVTSCARASFAFYNTKDEIDRFIEGLIKAQEIL
jgi:cysteine desulfurase/selenocysteine lyase